MAATLDDLRAIERLVGALPPEKLAELANIPAIKQRLGKWQPNPGPQTDAYYSKADCLLFGGQPGGGKAVATNTDIPTPYGFTSMGEIEVGDQVIDRDGVPCNVVAKSDILYEETYRLVFSDGSEILAGADHQWITTTRVERQRALKCTEKWRARRRATRPRRGTGKRPDLALRNTAWAKPQNPPTSGIRTTQEI